MSRNYLKRGVAALLSLAIAASLCACGETSAAPTETEETEAVIAETVPADGNADDVTCKGSYTAGDDSAANTVAATIGDARLTNEDLQVYYWLEVAAYQQAGKEAAPDFDRPLDTQLCEIDDTVTTWQQYFLKRALNTWHSAQALVLQGNDEGLPTEEAYQPNEKNHAEYLTEKPATAVLYGYTTPFTPNELHQAYLDNIPTMLEELAAEKGYSGAADMAKQTASATEEALRAYVELYNRGYMYFTNLSYYITVTPEEVEAYFAENEAAYKEEGITRSSGNYVNIRHILVVPETAQLEDGTTDEVAIADDGTVTCSEERWAACLTAAEEMLGKYEQGLKDNILVAHKTTEDAIFAELANKQSADEGTALDGGLLQHLSQGQLVQELDEWCFASERQAGDTAVIRTECGYHVVFFKGATEIWYAEAEEDLTVQKQAELITSAREKYPMEVDYSAIELTAAERSGNAVNADDVLYADVAHERYPVVQLYLQQDYPTTMYGNYKITSHGCGITTMAMLATYMTDTELTPPIMCDRYGEYCYKTGTDGSLFNITPAEMGFYLKEKVFDWRDAQAAMEEGYLVVVVQHKGFWTRGGHYLVLEKLTEDGRVQVRDSNIYNYGKLHDHKIDSFTWSTITPAGAGYWVYEKKIVSIPVCSRCGEEEIADTAMLTQDYTCEKCEPAILRRSSYLAFCGN